MYTVLSGLENDCQLSNFRLPEQLVGTETPQISLIEVLFVCVPSELLDGE